MDRNPNIAQFTHWAWQIALICLAITALVIISLQSSHTAVAQAVRTPTRTRRPTVTRTPTPTPTPVPFSLKNSNKTKPSDVLDEIFALGVGGDGDWCGARSGFDYPEIIYPQKDRESRYLMHQFPITACGWRRSEQVDLFIRYPNRKEVKRRVVAISDNDTYVTVAYFVPELQDPTGLYQFTYQGQSGRSTIYINVIRPVGAYAFWFKDGRLLLYQLQPYEKVRLIAYAPSETAKSGDVTLVGWQSYQVDRYGNLWIDVDNNISGSRFSTLVVVGEKSGESYQMTFLMRSQVIISSKLTHRTEDSGSILTESRCPGSPPQRMVIGERGKVCTKIDRLIVRSAPMRSARELFRLSPNTIIDIIDGPSCSDSWSWWKIRTIDRRTGWVAEGGDATDPYFICPVD